MRINRNLIFSQNQLLPTFDYTITVLSRLKAKDSITKQDVWYVNVIKNCDWTQQTVKNVTGNTVSMGGTYKVLIPKINVYLPYSLWKGSPDGHVTISEGDYIIKGLLNDDEIVTANTVQQVFQNHRPNAFQIRSFADYTGTIELAEHYEAEGV